MLFNPFFEGRARPPPGNELMQSHNDTNTQITQKTMDVGINVMTDTANTGIRGLGFTLAGTPLFYLLREEYLVVLLVFFVVYADYRLAKKECALRSAEAALNGETLAEKFKWRASRAWRRSLNKCMDDLLICTVGYLVGVIFVEPSGFPRLLGTLLFAAAVIIVECKSVWEHFANIRARWVSPENAGGFWAFVKRFAVIFAKRKDQDVGEALEEALNSNKG